MRQCPRWCPRLHYLRATTFHEIHSLHLSGILSHACVVAHVTRRAADRDECCRHSKNMLAPTANNRVQIWRPTQCTCISTLLHRGLSLSPHPSMLPRPPPLRSPRGVHSACGPGKALGDMYTYTHTYIHTYIHTYDTYTHNHRATAPCTTGGCPAAASATGPGGKPWKKQKPFI